jgi:ribose 5-phosphate isomerase A
MDREREKRRAAEAAADLVADGMRVGLGTGTTVAHLLDVLAARRARVVYVATSPRTRDAARARGLEVEESERWDRLDLAIDGADQIARAGWLMKGGGGAHTRERIVAASAERFVVIADSSKPVAELHGPVPLELAAFGLASTLRRLGAAVVRDGVTSPDGGVLADLHVSVADPATLARELRDTPGVVDHGLFEPALVSEVIVATGADVTVSARGAVP